jgi:hypothetical protein
VPFIAIGIGLLVVGGVALVVYGGKVADNLKNSTTAGADENATVTADTVALQGVKAASSATSSGIVDQAKPALAQAMVGTARAATREQVLQATFDGTTVPTADSENNEVSSRTINDASAALSPSATRVRSGAFIASDPFDPSAVAEAVDGEAFQSVDSRELLIDDGLEAKVDAGQAFTQS